MREIGIIKWFGGHNYKTDRENNFGFITPLTATSEDIYVHRNDFPGAPQEVAEGSIVTYVEGSNRGKTTAVEVKFLGEERDVATLKRALSIDKVSPFAATRIFQLGLDSGLSSADLVLALKHLRDAESFWMALLSRLELLDDNVVSDLFAYGIARHRSLPSELSKVPQQVLQDDELSPKLSTGELARIWQWLALRDDTLLAKRYFNDWLERDDRNELDSANAVNALDPDSFHLLKDAEVLPVLAIALKQPGGAPDSAKQLVEEAAKRNLQIHRRDSALFEGVELVQSIARPIVHPDFLLQLAWADDQANKIWQSLDGPFKLAVILRSIVLEEPFHENHPAHPEMQAEGSHILVRAGGLLYDFGQSKINSEDASTAYDLLEDWVAEQVNVAAFVTLGPALPECLYYIPIAHCEARPWPTASQNTDSEDKPLPVNAHVVGFCPRIGAEAHLAGREQADRWMSGCYSAHIFRLDGRSTLVEGLAKLDLPLPEREGWSEHKSYPGWLSGAINRVNEIRKRLKCLHCEGPLHFNPYYAKRLARYRSTVADCKTCQTSTYFNHCWNCGSIIDSRFSKHRSGSDENGYYYCIKCSAGDKSIREIGTTCPKCGGKGTLSRASSNWTARGRCAQQVQDEHLTCTNCKHEVIARGSQGVRLGPQHVVRDYAPAQEKDLAYIPRSEHVR